MSLRLDPHRSDFTPFNVSEINSAINLIDTNKSYKLHCHWKYLSFSNNISKLCLVEIFNSWAFDVMNNTNDKSWSLFDTSLRPIPKNGKRRLSELKSWRPISVGTSENWILEKVFLSRLSPFLETSDCQFGYKEEHSAAHAIELVRVLERGSDCHVCMLDASSAFDTLSWYRIKDQLLDRNVPLYLIQLCLTQLSSNRISVCGTAFIYPRVGVKQGGVLSGRYFSLCYDKLISMLRRTGSGVLLYSFHKCNILLQIIVYADDIVLVSRSPNGLAELINVTLSFAQLYSDIKFNPSKSCILRLGKTSKPAVSVNRIPVAESHDYLGVPVGRKADPFKTSATKLYTKTNIMIKENKELGRCSIYVKKHCCEKLRKCIRP